MNKLTLLLLLSIVCLGSAQATVQKPLDEESTYKLLIDNARFKAELEDNPSIFWKTQSTLLRKIRSEYMDDVFMEWAPYIVTQRVEQKPLEEATINKIDKTLESLNKRCRKLVDLVRASKLSHEQRAKLAKRKSEKEAAGRVAYAKLKAKQKAHKSCAKAFNCNGTELAELRLAEKEYLPYRPCNDCSGSGGDSLAEIHPHCPKFVWDGELYTYDNPFWHCKAGYKRSGNSCVKEEEFQEAFEANIRVFVDGPDGYIIQGGVCKGVGCPN